MVYPDGREVGLVLRYHERLSTDGCVVWAAYGPAGYPVTRGCRVVYDYLPNRAAVTVVLGRDRWTGREWFAAAPGGHPLGQRPTTE